MNPEDFSPRKFARGRRFAFDLEFTAAGHTLRVPVILVRGAREGKTLVVTAAVHGDEYEGVRTLLELGRELNPGEMSGDLLAIPVLNPPAFWNGTRTSPLDGANLARVCPGRADGTPTEVIAYYLDRSILPYADLYLDLHSAGVKMAMPTLIGYDASDPGSRDAAFAFDAPVIWGHPEIAPGRTVSAAKARAIPFLYTEARGAGRIHPDDLRIYRRGVLNLMRHLHILEGAPERGACRYHLLGEGNIDESIAAAHRGFLIPAVSLLDEVQEDQELGAVVDLYGEPIEHIRSPRSGLVVLIHEFPVIEPGEPAFLVTGKQS